MFVAGESNELTIEQLEGKLNHRSIPLPPPYRSNCKGRHRPHGWCPTPSPSLWTVRLGWWSLTRVLIQTLKDSDIMPSSLLTSPFDFRRGCGEVLCVAHSWFLTGCSHCEYHASFDSARWCWCRCADCVYYGESSSTVLCSSEETLLLINVASIG